jgi:hypothetical protein
LVFKSQVTALGHFRRNQRGASLVDIRFASKAPKPGRARSVAFGRTPMIQTPKLGARIMRYELADYEWDAIKPMLPTSRVAFLV